MSGSNALNLCEWCGRRIVTQLRSRQRGEALESRADAQLCVVDSETMLLTVDKEGMKTSETRILLVGSHEPDCRCLLDVG